MAVGVLGDRRNRILGGNAVSHGPAAATRATAAQPAAGAGFRNVCTGIVASLLNFTGANVATPEIHLWDGASGSTLKFRAYLSVPAVAGAVDRLVLDGLWIEGSDDTVMTLAFETAAPPAGVLESVTLITTVIPA